MSHVSCLLQSFYSIRRRRTNCFRSSHTHLAALRPPQSPRTALYRPRHPPMRWHLHRVTTITATLLLPACLLTHTHTHMHSRAGISHASLLAKCSHTNLFTKIPQWGLSAMNLVLCSCTRRRQKRTQMFKQRTPTAPAPLPGLNQISPTVPIPFHPVLSLTHL